MNNHLQFLSRYCLRWENKLFRGTGGVSQHNRKYRFEPAFCDLETGKVYPSCRGDGTPATCHMIEGLPMNLAIERDCGGRITKIKSTVIAGFVRSGHFYTREQAAQAVAAIQSAASPARARFAIS